MKAKDVQIHGTYIAKVSNKRTKVSITGTSSYGGWNAQNLATGREIYIKTAARLTPLPPPRDLAGSTGTVEVLENNGG